MRQLCSTSCASHQAFIITAKATTLLTRSALVPRFALAAHIHCSLHASRIACSPNRSTGHHACCSYCDKKLSHHRETVLQLAVGCSLRLQAMKHISDS